MAPRTRRSTAATPDATRAADPETAGEDAPLGPPSVAEVDREHYQDPDAPEESTEPDEPAEPAEGEFRHEPNASEQADLDAVAAGSPNASVLAAIEHAKDDPDLKTPKGSLPASDGTPRVMSARVIDNAIVYVCVGDHTHVLTSDEALALSGAISAIAVELVR